ncbi:MAG: biotin carboxylase N-terminal domain-containing protein [candidate division WOR-3 bacterium]
MGIKKVLIANRGEIAIRVARTLKELDIKTVGIFTKADEDWPFVYVMDEAYPVDSYLNIDEIVKVAVKSGCDAVHPGYGFLAENPRFAQAVLDAGLEFIGPRPLSMELVGDKAKSKEIAQKVGVPTVPGLPPSEDPDEIYEGILNMGFPVLLKAVGGGGGKGMKLIQSEENLKELILSAQREAFSAFGDKRLIAEKYVFPARHVEVQIIGDKYGNVFVLGERECSLQRRHQKIVEESPSIGIDENIRQILYDYAIRIGKGVNYENAGTCEFIVSENGDVYFLEVNARLQVEHPVTEMVTGLDLVRLQVEVARGNMLKLENIVKRGHAIEVRLYAEDPENNFLPSSGRVLALEFPHIPGIRVDTGINEGTEITPLYDPMIAKIISYAPDREQARKKLINALEETLFIGPKTNQHFLIYLLESDEFKTGKTYTHTVGEILERYKSEKYELPEEIKGAVESYKTDDAFRIRREFVELWSLVKGKVYP